MFQKSWVWWHIVILPLGRWKQVDAEAHWPTYLVGSRKSCLKKKKMQGNGIWGKTPSVDLWTHSNTCEHIPLVHLHTHTYIPRWGQLTSKSICTYMAERRRRECSLGPFIGTCDSFMRTPLSWPTSWCRHTGTRMSAAALELRRNIHSFHSSRLPSGLRWEEGSYIRTSRVSALTDKPDRSRSLPRSVEVSPAITAVPLLLPGSWVAQMSVC